MNKINFIHLADIHLFSLAYQKFNLDGFDLLSNIVDNANDNNVELIFIAGDIFHSLPSLSNISRLNTILSNFKGNTFIILGNHDYLSPLSKLRKYNWATNVHVFNNINISSIYLSELNVRVWGKSYDSNQTEISLYNDYFDKDTLNKEEINVLLAHGGDAKHIPTNFSELGNVGFSYVAFGHLHTYKTVGKNIVYSGSLIPQDHTEEGDHGYVSGSLSVTETFYSLTPNVYKYLTIDVDVSNLYNAEEIYNYIKNKLQTNTYYTINFIGKKFFDISLDDELFYDAGNIENIVDNTTLDINYEELMKHNENNILGVFIKQLKNSDNPLASRALELGVSAFLEAKDDVN